MHTDNRLLQQRFNTLLAEKPAFCSLRVVRQQHETLSVHRDVVQPLRRREDVGAMISVFDHGAFAYAATPDLSLQGLRTAFDQARELARACTGNSLLDESMIDSSVYCGSYQAPVVLAWSEVALKEKLDILREQCARLKCGDDIINWQASLWHIATETCYLSSHGSHIEQSIQALMPELSVSAYRQGETQSRSAGGGAHVRQGGLEMLEQIGFYDAAPRIAGQALELLQAPDCPDDVCDIILAPDQMALQIHESIGHPLELDRILGDERNYAGTSFVTPDMFGVYRYGSDLLNVTFAPDMPGEIAAYQYDDEGQPARREYLIKDGILQRPLGGALSQRRANLPGVANSRACSWNRPPIDRMANLNVEPGDSSFAELVSQIERGVYMEANRSWSIDDSRNKFQFGCEWARIIENGELKQVVKNPNYRGISAEFWRSLDGVGDAASVEIMAAAYCGKGEPNQGVNVGHASPPCLFRDVSVFGGG